VVAIIAGGSLVLGLAAAIALKLGVYRPLLVLAFLVLLAAWYAFSADYARAVARLSRWRGVEAGPRPSQDAAESEAH
jgi:UDP-GlcNAc:undecaprenyl-phosphate GlcNAc-1-phosphate transferase